MVGKTSLLKAIVGQHPISDGEIVWQGETLRRLRPFSARDARMAYVPQERDLFPLLTVQENLETGYAPLPRSDRSLPEDIFQIFPVLKDMFGRRGDDLSGGQQQQLAIARALVTRPLLLVLDEPTEGIQPSIIKDIERVIAHLRDRGDIAILLVEQ